MRLRHLKFLHAFVRAGSVSGAAQVLHTPHPAATQLLQHAPARFGMRDAAQGCLRPPPQV